MSKTRNLSDLLDANGDVKSTALDNVPASDVVNDTTPQLGGNLDSNGNAINMADNNQINFGNSTDGRIVHNGTDFIIQDLGTGDLKLVGDQVRITDGSGAENKAVFTSNGSADLYYDNAKKFETTATGVSVTGNIDLGDNEYVRFGDSQDLRIYHDGSNSFIQDAGTGSLVLQGTNLLIRTNNGDNVITATENAEVTLAYDNATKLQTTSTGVSVTGDLSVSGSISGAGKVGQVVQSVKTDTSSTSSGSWDIISGLTASITPSSTSSKILISFNLNVGQSNSTTAVFRIYRGNSTIVGVGQADGNREQVTARVSPDNVHWTFPVSNEFLDSPSTTSSITYAIRWKNNSNTVYINRNNSNNNDGSRDQTRPISTITLMEILP